MSKQQSIDLRQPLKPSYEMKDMSSVPNDSPKSPTISRRGYEPEECSEYSDEESDREREEEVRRELRNAEIRRSQNKKIVVGNGYDIDITQFFDFEMRQSVGSKVEGGKSLFEALSKSRVSWLILLWSVLTGAMIPCWHMHIPANKALQISWRFIMQALMTVPFVLHEYRTGGPSTVEMYQISYILKPSNFIKPFISSMASCIWFTLIPMGYEWTHVCHCMVLGSLANFFLSMRRSSMNASHNFELGGQMLVILGVIMAVIDTLKFETASLLPEDHSYKNTKYYNRTWWQRLTFDLGALLMSFITARFSLYTSDLKNYYPPFLSVLMVNIMNIINMAFSSFFIYGCNYDHDPFWGFWSIFSNKHFGGFMYMAIVLFMGKMASILMITKMFPDPLLPALALTLEPFINIVFLYTTGIQRIPDGLTLIGFFVLFPGLCLILVGQYRFQASKSNQEEQEYYHARLQSRLSEIMQRRRQRQIRSVSKAKSALIKIKSV